MVSFANSLHVRAKNHLLFYIIQSYNFVVSHDILLINRSVAQEVFKEIVEEIKRRRIIETRLNMESLEIEFGQQVSFSILFCLSEV